MSEVIRRVLHWLRLQFESRPPDERRDPHWLRLQFGSRPPDERRDPYARVPVPLRPRPAPRSGAVALEEPDE